jgi:microcystin-dependent protein
VGYNYVGEVRLVGFNFAPYGWAFCQGQTLPISEYNALFNLIGTTYGGDGQQTFGLPNLQGRTPIGQGQLAGGSNYVIGQIGGVESVTIGGSQYPNHNHFIQGSTSPGHLNAPGGNTVGGLKIYASIPPPASAMSSSVLGPSAGGSLPHNNLQPFQVLNWVIALFGIYPSQ